MNCVSFQNNGVIDMRAVKTFGASAKETDNPIGYFGTGLKYAIAVLLRLGCTVELYEGAKKHTFSTKKINLRNTEFDIVTLDDEELGFTTELGKNWENWQAFRELYCNAMDEIGGNAVNKRLEPSDDTTTIIVAGAPIIDAWHKRGQIILQHTPRWISEGVEIIERPSNHLYYRGIRVADLQHPSKLTYNIVGREMRLTEDRTLASAWLANAFIAEAVAATDDENLVTAVLTARPAGQCLETKLGFNGVSDTMFGPAFMRVMDRLDYGEVTNPSAKEMFRRLKGADFSPSTIPEERLTAEEREMLDRAKTYCTDLLGESTVTRYPIHVSDALTDNTLGMADTKRNCVYLARRTFARGTKQVVGTLYEELIHLKHGVIDETRQMQNFLLDNLMSTYERVLGHPM